MAIVIPGFEFVDIGPDGGSFDQRNNPKLGWHTWEGYGWRGAEGAFAKYPPHCAVNPRDGRKRQYVSLDRHAYAFAGSNNDNDYIIQVEVAGYANDSAGWDDDTLRFLGQQVVAPIVALTGIPPIITPRGFKGAGEGIVLASKNSPHRMSQAELHAFSGHCGHQHMPSPDHHWDPGRLNVARILEWAGQAPIYTPVPSTPAPIPSHVNQVDSKGRPTLRIGSRGQAVRDWQRLRGVAVDGVFGKNTAYSTKEFQAACKLVVDGIVGPATWKAMDDVLAWIAATQTNPTRPTIRRGAKGGHVSYLQGRLGVREDGDFGPVTERAVRAFQSRKGLKADGIVGAKTWAAIG